VGLARVRRAVSALLGRQQAVRVNQALES